MTIKTDDDDQASGGPTLWCPMFHNITGHYDPSGPILIDGTWHVFPDGSTAPGKGWSESNSKPTSSLNQRHSL